MEEVACNQHCMGGPNMVPQEQVMSRGAVAGNSFWGLKGKFLRKFSIFIVHKYANYATKILTKQ